MLRMSPFLISALFITTPVFAQDSTAKNPLAKPPEQAGNPLAKEGGSNPLARTPAQESAAAADLWIGTYTGKHVLGPITVEVRRDGADLVIVDRSSQPNSTGKVELTPDGYLKGQYVMKLMGFTRRHNVELRREEGGYRYRTTGQNTLLTRQ